MDNFRIVTPLATRHLTSKTLLSTPTINLDASLSQPPSAIVTDNDRAVFIAYPASCKLTKFDLDGEIDIKIHSIYFGLSSIAIDPTSGEAYCISNGKFKELLLIDLKTGKTQLLLKTENKLKSLAITRNRHLLLGDETSPLMYVYRRNGLSYLRTVTCICVPKAITVCPSTGKIAIATQKKGVQVFDENYYKVNVFPCHFHKIDSSFHDIIFD